MGDLSINHIFLQALIFWHQLEEQSIINNLFNNITIQPSKDPILLINSKLIIIIFTFPIIDQANNTSNYMTVRLPSNSSSTSNKPLNKLLHNDQWVLLINNNKAILTTNLINLRMPPPLQYIMQLKALK